MTGFNKRYRRSSSPPIKRIKFSSLLTLSTMKNKAQDYFSHTYIHRAHSSNSRNKQGLHLQPRRQEVFQLPWLYSKIKTEVKCIRLHFCKVVNKNLHYTYIKNSFLSDKSMKEMPMIEILPLACSNPIIIGISICNME